MTDATQDPKRPHVWWYPQPERLIINAAKYATPDPRDARLAELEKALREIRTVSGDADSFRVASEHVFAAIWSIANTALVVGALTGAEPEPEPGDVVEVMAI